jgi:hypothetical protein
MGDRKSCSAGSALRGAIVKRTEAWGALAHRDAHLLEVWAPQSSVADPDVWDRIRIRALINDSVSTFLVCVKAINTVLTGKESMFINFLVHEDTL